MDRGAWWAADNGITKEVDHDLATKQKTTSGRYMHLKNYIACDPGLDKSTPEIKCSMGKGHWRYSL